MSRRSTIVGVLMLFVPVFLTSGCHSRPPDITQSKAAELIERAPEFNQYARLVKIGRIVHATHSAETISEGDFTFRHLDAPADVPPIQGNADFRYWDGTWHLNQFEYGCRGVQLDDCHIVHVYNDPPKP